MKEFFSKKGKGYLFSLAALLFTAIGLIFFRMLTAVSVEQSEHPALIIGLAFGSIFLNLIATYKDYAKVPSIAAYATTTALFFSLIEGRVSYLAFYFSGDVMNTGLSPYLVTALVLFLLAMVCALFSVICKQEKDEQYSFRPSDLKVVIPMVVLVAVLCGVALLNSSGSPIDTDPSTESTGSLVSEPAGATNNPQSEGNYKTPTVAEDVWQGYTPEDYLAEDVSAKTIVYQLTGSATIEGGGEAKQFDAILNLCEDGESVLSVYGRGHRYDYYGYWTNEEDDHLWFCVACYTIEGMDGVCTIDYSYDLTGHFDEITINIALGFADGGQFVRNMPIGGNGSVSYASAEDFLREKGWEPTQAPSGSGNPVGGGEGNDAEGEPLFRFTSDSENYLLDCYADGTYKFTFVTAGLVESGEWTWKDWTFSLTDSNGKVTVADKDDESHALSLHFVAAIDERVNRDFTCDATTWGTALGTTGNYEPVSEASVLFSFASDSENYLLDCYADGTYKFTFVTAGLVESGEWTWKDWTFSLTDSNGKVTVADKDDESHALSLHFVAAIDERVNRDFTCDATTWGTALGLTGNYGD